MRWICNLTATGRAIRIVGALAIAFSVLPFHSCDSNDSTNISQPPPEGRQWTVMVYMNADDGGSDSLEEFATQDFNEMEMVGSTEYVTILAQLDRIPGYDTTNDDWAGARRYLITYDPTYDRSSASPDVTFRSTLLQSLGEVDMGDWRTLREFVKWAKTAYPAKHYALVIWDHGSGVNDFGRKRSAAQWRGVSFDDTSDNFITTPQLGLSLDAVKPVDIVAFDASLMGMVEIAYEMRGTATYLCASEESPPGEGYRYDLWLGALKQKPTMTPEELARTIVQVYVNDVGQRTAVTEAAIKLNKMAKLANAVNAFASILQSYREEYAQSLANARNIAQYYADPDFKDLYHYAELVYEYVPVAEVRAAAQAVMDAVNEAVLLSAYKGASVANSHGLSIFLPGPPPPFASTSYLKTSFAKDTNWDEWLQAQVR